MPAGAQLDRSLASGDAYISGRCADEAAVHPYLGTGDVRLNRQDGKPLFERRDVLSRCRGVVGVRAAFVEKLLKVSERGVVLEELFLAPRDVVEHEESSRVLFDRPVDVVELRERGAVVAAL